MVRMTCHRKPGSGIMRENQAKIWSITWRTDHEDITILQTEHIAFAMKEASSGTPVEEVCRKTGNQSADILSVEEEVR